MSNLSQSDFARELGISRSYITKLKADGRLVMTEAGEVDVEASKKRIIETADPNRDDVVTRWAKTRGAPEVPPGEEDEPPATGSYASARARKENAAADVAEMERDKMRGLLIERDAVAAAVEDVMTIVRQALEQQPHRVAPMLIGADLDQIRATLKQENNAALGEMVREFQKRIRQMAGEEE